MEDVDKLDFAAEDARRTSDSIERAKKGFNDFLEGDPEQQTISSGLEKLREASRILGFSVRTAQRQQIIAGMAESFEDRLLARQAEWAAKQPRRSLAAAILPWRAVAESEAARRYEAGNPPPLEPGMLYSFNEILVTEGLVPRPEARPSRLEQLRSTLGKIKDRSKTSPRPRT